MVSCHWLHNSEQNRWLVEVFIYFRKQIVPSIQIMDTPCDVTRKKMFKPYALSKKIYAEITINIPYWWLSVFK